MMKLPSLIALLALHLGARAQEIPHSFSESYKVAQPAQLTVSTSDGNIAVLASDKSAIEVLYIAEKNNKVLQISRAELEKEVTLTVTPGSNSLDIAIKYPNLSLLDSRNRITLHLKIYVPKQTSCNLKTSDGNVAVAGLTSNQQVVTSDGNIQFSNISGTVKGNTSDGNISAKHIKGASVFSTSDGNIGLEDITGNVSATTSDGNVQANQIKGDLSLRTSDGHIDFTATEGSVSAVTSEGNISGSISKLLRELTLRASDGNITVAVPQGLGLDLDLKGTAVQTSLKNFSGTSKKNSVQGKMNGGGIPVRISVSDGNVALNYK